MLIAGFMLLAAALGQQSSDTPKPEPVVLKAGLGSCSAEFTVNDSEGKPVYLAVIHARIRYGIMSLKRMDIEVSTNSDGKAGVDGLPEKARPVAYEIQKDGKSGSVTQKLADQCHGTYVVALK